MKHTEQEIEDAKKLIDQRPADIARLTGSLKYGPLSEFELLAQDEARNQINQDHFIKIINRTLFNRDLMTALWIVGKINRTSKWSEHVGWLHTYSLKDEPSRMVIRIHVPGEERGMNYSFEFPCRVDFEDIAETLRNKFGGTYLCYPQ